MSVLAGALAGAALLCAGLCARSIRRARIVERSTRRAESQTGAIKWWRRSAALDARARSALLGIACAAAGFALARAPGAAIGGLAGAAAPVLLDRRRAAAARVRVDEQLTDAVSAIGAGLRAGLSLAQSIRFAADESASPLRPGLAGIGDRAALGMPLGASIDAWADVHGGRDARLVAAVLSLHRRSGGDLPSVLDRLAETLRERRAASREIRSLTAQGRMSGAILGLLPIAFFCFRALTSPQDLAVALHSSVGITAIAVGFAMQAAAFLWIRALLRVS
jgi:tight adherence protein B